MLRIPGCQACLVPLQGLWDPGRECGTENGGCPVTLAAQLGRPGLLSFILIIVLPAHPRSLQCSICTGKPLLFIPLHDFFTLCLVPPHNRPSSFPERLSEKTNLGMFGSPAWNAAFLHFLHGPKCWSHFYKVSRPVCFLQKCCFCKHLVLLLQSAGLWVCREQGCTGTRQAWAGAGPAGIWNTMFMLAGYLPRSISY